MRKVVIAFLAVAFLALCVPSDAEARGHRHGLGKGRIKALIAKLIHRR